MRILTYNIRAGFGTDNVRSLNRIVDVIRSSGADIVCLQEVDLRMIRTMFVDQPRWLEKHLNMQSVYQRNFVMGFGGMGNLILSRYPLVEATPHALSSRLEQRGLLEVIIDTPEGRLSVFCTHWGLSGEERKTQASETAAILNASKSPVILCGDFNESSIEPALASIISASNLTDLVSEVIEPEPTFPSNDPKVRIDYVLGSPQIKASSASFIDSPASDHRAVLVEFSLTP